MVGCGYRIFSKKGRYAIPGGEALIVDRSEVFPRYDGARSEEKWPTTHQRLMVCGPHVFGVDPIDDSFVFAWENDGDDLRRVIIGFRIFSFVDTAD